MKQIKDGMKKIKDGMSKRNLPATTQEITIADLKDQIKTLFHEYNVQEIKDINDELLADKRFPHAISAISKCRESITIIHADTPLDITLEYLNIQRQKPRVMKDMGDNYNYDEDELHFVNMDEVSAVPKRIPLFHIDKNMTDQEYLRQQGHVEIARANHFYHTRKKLAMYGLFMFTLLAVAYPLVIDTSKVIPTPEDKLSESVKDIELKFNKEGKEFLLNQGEHFTKVIKPSMLPFKNHNVLYKKIGNLPHTPVMFMTENARKIDGVKTHDAYVGDGFYNFDVSSKVFEDGETFINPFNPNVKISTFVGFDNRWDINNRKTPYASEQIDLFKLLGHHKGVHVNKNLFVGNNIGLSQVGKIMNIYELPKAIKLIEKVMSGDPEMKGDTLLSHLGADKTNKLPISYFTTGGNNDKPLYDQTRDYMWSSTGINIFEYTDDTMLVGMIVNTNPFNEKLYMEQKPETEEGSEYEIWLRAYEKAKSKHIDNFEAVHMVFHRGVDGKVSGSLIVDLTEYWSRQMVGKINDQNNMIDALGLSIFPTMNNNQRFWKEFLTNAYSVAIKNGHKVLFEPYLMGNMTKRSYISHPSYPNRMDAIPLSAQFEISMLHKIYTEYEKGFKDNISQLQLNKSDATVESLYKRFNSRNDDFYINNGYLRGYLNDVVDENDYFTDIMRVMNRK